MNSLLKKHEIEKPRLRMKINLVKIELQIAKYKIEHCQNMQGAQIKSK